MDKLDPIPQQVFDENRERFDAVSSAFDLKNFDNKCSHTFKRISYSEVACTGCSFHLIDNNRFVLEQGKIVGVK